MESKAKRQEMNELNTLINKGATFEITDYEIKHTKFFFGLLKKRKIKEVKREYTIKEPTLSTLDRISSEAIHLDFDEDAVKSDIGVNYVRSLTASQSKRCAKIIAYAVVGSNYSQPHVGAFGQLVYKDNDDEVERLTDLFYRVIKPSELMKLSLMINAMSNLGDFINSIRLMSASRTTTPILVEKED